MMVENPFLKTWQLFNIEQQDTRYRDPSGEEIGIH